MKPVGEGAELTVSDDGRGFDPAANGPVETTDGHIGIEVLRDLVEVGGGELRFESAPGRGTIVRLSLPRP